MQVTVEEASLIQLYFGGVHKNNIIKSHYRHLSQKGDQHRGLDQGVDWNTLAKLSRKIQYHIRSRLAVATVPARPVLMQAYRMAQNGYALKEYHDYPSCNDMMTLKARTGTLPPAMDGDSESSPSMPY